MPRLTPLDDYVRAAVRAWVARQAVRETGVACPGCGAELLKVRPPVQTTAERVWVLTSCANVRCGERHWLPD